jgi:hypothetical protein
MKLDKDSAFIGVVVVFLGALVFSKKARKIFLGGNSYLGHHLSSDSSAVKDFKDFKEQEQKQDEVLVGESIVQSPNDWDNSSLSYGIE